MYSKFARNEFLRFNVNHVVFRFAHNLSRLRIEFEIESSGWKKI